MISLMLLKYISIPFKSESAKGSTSVSNISKMLERNPKFKSDTTVLIFIDGQLIIVSFDGSGPSKSTPYKVRALNL